MLNYGPEGDLCFIVQRLNRRLSRRIDQALQSLHLTGEQATLLAALDAARSARTKDLSPMLGLDASTISANIKPLLNGGLVSVAVDPVDRRAKRLSLTAAGAGQLEIARSILAELQSKCRSEVSAKTSLEELYRALNAAEG